jgi:hypothetical protein
MLMYGVEVRMNLKEKYKISHQLPIDGHFQVERNDQPNSKGAPPKFSLKIVNNVKSFVVYAKVIQHTPAMDGTNGMIWYH